MGVVMMTTTMMTKSSGKLACLIWEVQGAEHSKQQKDQVTPTIHSIDGDHGDHGDHGDGIHPKRRNLRK